MPDIRMTNRQARRFLLLKHGLLGAYRFSGKRGALDYIRQAGCIQFDPVDVCGKNAELVLQSRVKGFTKPMLAELLYKDRALVDYFDKNLSIFAVGDWPYFRRTRTLYAGSGRSRDEIAAVRERLCVELSARGPLCSADLAWDEQVSWYWSDTRLSRAALEHLYFTGELCVHHKKGSIKYYDLAENCIPASLLSVSEPHPDDRAHVRWRVLRRIGAVGLLWNRASDAFLGIDSLTAAARADAFADLARDGTIVPAAVDGVAGPLYLLSQDRELLDTVLTDPRLAPRCELLAPLDNLLWDRKLIRALFRFDYKWEIYTPPPQRKYGHYVLPVLCGDAFLGRIEAACDRKRRALVVSHLWLEDGAKMTEPVRRALRARLERFAEFNGCACVEGDVV